MTAASSVPITNIAHLLERAAARRGGAPAIVAPNGQTTWTFEGLAGSAARFAGWLVDLGLAPGDRVLVLEPRLPELYRLIVGTVWAGGCAVLPPASLPLARAIQVAGSESPRAVVASLPLWPLALASTALRSAPIRLTSGSWPFPGTRATGSSHADAIAPVPVAASSPAILSFTTGSTGPTKAIPRTHGVLAAQHAALAALRRLDDTSLDLVGMPVLVLHDLGSGATSVATPRGPGSARYGARIREVIRSAKPTSAAGFPHLFESALDGMRGDGLAGLRTIHVGGSRVRRDLLVTLRSAAPRARITVVYGSTEVEPIAAIEAEEYLDRLADSDPSDGVCVGRVLEGLELRLAAPGSDESGSPLVPSGRILLRGARASSPEASDGWVDTGDVGRLDADARLWLLGRASNAMSGLRPTEAERTVERLAWVARAALVSAAGARSRGRLAVEPNAWPASTTRRAWLAALDGLVAERNWPIDDVVLVRHLPRLPGAAAKVDDDRIRRL